MWMALFISQGQGHCVCGQPYSLASKDIVYVDGLIH